MPYAITITGLDSVRRLLGTDYKPAIAAATEGIALQVWNEVAPYPPATEANSPGNPTGRWYERGEGARRLRKDGSIWKGKQSEVLGRQWFINDAQMPEKTGGGNPGRARGMMSIVANRASYAQYLHAAGKQVMWASKRQWTTDLTGVQRTVASGVARRIVTAAILAALRRH